MAMGPTRLRCEGKFGGGLVGAGLGHVVRESGDQGDKRFREDARLASLAGLAALDGGHLDGLEHVSNTATQGRVLGPQLLVLGAIVFGLAALLVYHKIVCALQALGVPLRKRDVQIELCSLVDAAVEYLKELAACRKPGGEFYFLEDFLAEFHHRHRLGQQLDMAAFMSLMRAMYVARLMWHTERRNPDLRDPNPAHICPLALAVDELENMLGEVEGEWRQAMATAELDSDDGSDEEDGDGGEKRNTNLFQAPASAESAADADMATITADTKNPAFVALAQGVKNMGLGFGGEAMGTGSGNGMDAAGGPAPDADDLAQGVKNMNLGPGGAAMGTAKADNGMDAAGEAMDLD
ncbi:hypothetical protein VTJ49DRAFT_7011 [Mycothermus thermophilus]|uniref:Uncharacterized protein n=1 Tax=Humicola insolens TaxID=85995 RepID=A0ABR3VKM5_HUMIN